MYEEEKVNYEEPFKFNFDGYFKLDQSNVKLRDITEINRVFPWRVIDKKRESDHPLFFRRYEDLKDFYLKRTITVPTDEWRVVMVDTYGTETQRFEYNVIFTDFKP